MQILASVKIESNTLLLLISHVFKLKLCTITLSKINHVTALSHSLAMHQLYYEIVKIYKIG